MFKLLCIYHGVGFQSVNNGPSSVSGSGSGNQNESEQASGQSQGGGQRLSQGGGQGGGQVETEQHQNGPSFARDPAEGLPAGWSMQMAPNGRVFFIDHNVKATTWVDPRSGRASPMPNAVAKEPPHRQQPADELGPLPEGWEERVHSDGRIFFIDHSKILALRRFALEWEKLRLSLFYPLCFLFRRHENNSVGRSPIIKSSDCWTGELKKISDWVLSDRKVVRSYNSHT